MVTGFSELAYYFQTYGVLDFLLPFILVFTIIFAVSAKLPLFSEHKNFRVVIALVLALLFVVPHIVGTYPLGYDPVQVMNETLPSVALVAVASIMLLILMGLFGTGFSKAAAPIIAIAAIAFVAYIFGSSLNILTGPSEVFSWWSDGLTELLVIILIFGVIVYLVVREPSTGDSPGKKIFKSIGDLFERT